jgi:hypothetical protein
MNPDSLKNSGLRFLAVKTRLIQSNIEEDVGIVENNYFGLLLEYLEERGSGRKLISNYKQ